MGLSIHLFAKNPLTCGITDEKHPTSTIKVHRQRFDNNRLLLFSIGKALTRIKCVKGKKKTIRTYILINILLKKTSSFRRNNTPIKWALVVRIKAARWYFI